MRTYKSAPSESLLEKIIVGLVIAVVGCAIVAAFTLLAGWLLWLFWSGVMVAAFHLPPLTLWQCILA